MIGKRRVAGNRPGIDLTGGATLLLIKTYCRITFSAPELSHLELLDFSAGRSSLTQRTKLATTRHPQYPTLQAYPPDASSDDLALDEGRLSVTPIGGHFSLPGRFA